MFNKEMHALGSKRSVIRELFEYGKKRAQELGADKVYDFSLGNPNTPAPQCVNDAIMKYTLGASTNMIHGYTSAQGDAGARKAIADYIVKAHGAGAEIGADNIYITCGAAASLTITLKALTESAKDEFVVIAPFFPEYGVFIKSAGANMVVVPMERNCQIDFRALEQAIGPNTKGVIINSPNNPSGAVYGTDTVTRLCVILSKKSREHGAPIFLIADEPYREIVYDEATVPYLPKLYADTVVCYSYSKALSLAGERIGYIAVTPSAHGAKELYASICGAGRALGYVCAPSLMQAVIKDCVGKTADLSVYKTNRDLLYGHLTSLGFECVKPMGAFYLFVKSPTPNFCDVAKQKGLLLVPGDDFGALGWLRIAYCVSTEMLVRALPIFTEAWNERA